MNKKINLIGKIGIAFVLFITCIVAVVDSSALEFVEDLGIKSKIEYSNKKDQATISFDVHDFDVQYDLEAITSPEAEPLDLNNLAYITHKNGEYTFDVQYYKKEEAQPSKLDEQVVDKQEEKRELLHYALKVNVDGIFDKQKIEEIKQISTSLIPKQDISTQAQADGAVNIEIANYNDTTGWMRGDIKEVRVNVDFADITSPNKKVTINVPEGLRYEQISIKADTDTTGADTKILTTYESGDPLIASATAIILPKKETVASKNSTFGELEYQFLDTVQSVTIKFQVGVDLTRYYGPHTMKNPISVDARKGNNVLVGGSVIKQTVKLVGAELSKGFITYYNIVNTPGTKEAVVSTAKAESLGRMPQYYMGLRNGLWKDMYRYAKSVTMDLYIPVGMEYHSIKNIQDFTVISKDNTTGRVTIKIDDWMTRNDFWLYYKIPVGKAVGTYPVTSYDKITFTWYDGTTQTVSRTGAQYSVNVVSNPVNKMSFIASKDTSADPSVEHYVQGTTFIVSNASAGKRTNQTIEFTIDPNWQAVALNLPFDQTIATNKITKVYYKTNKKPNAWSEYSITTGVPAIRTVAVLKKTDMKDNLGKNLMAADEYFTSVKANVGDFSQDYMTSRQLNHVDNVCVFGKYAKDSKTDLAPITVSMYDETNKMATTISDTRNVIKTPITGRKFITSSIVNFKNSNNQVVKGVIAGSSVNVIATIAARNDNLALTQAMVNPEIYLREPKGMTIIKDSIFVKDNHGTIVEFDLKPHTNNKNETIYKLITKNCVMGVFLDEALTINNQFIVTYTIATSASMDATSMKVNELVAWGKKGENYGAVNNYNSTAFKDIYDFDGDNNYENMLPSVLDAPFSIAENKNVLVESFLSFANETPSVPYTEGIDSTLVYFTPGTSANYTMKITNNSESVANTKVYIPIPKTNDNFGAGFQVAPFTWDMKLKGKLTAQNGFTITYATGVNGKDYLDDSKYTTNPSDLTKVNMVKIEAKNLAVNASATFHVPLQIDETYDSATQVGSEKVKTRNIYNPRYSVDSTTFNGDLPGTKVGAELIITEIGGLIFEDENGNGIYDAKDLTLSNQKVELYKWDETLKTYQPVKDDNGNVFTMSDQNGNYLFDYNYNLGKGVYALKFEEKDGYEFLPPQTKDSKVDSNVMIEGANKGWIDNIDGTIPIAKTLGCGYISYDPTNDLTLSLPTTIQQGKVNESISVTPKIKPNFWETIKGINAYEWKLVNASDEEYVALDATNQKTITINGKKKTPIHYEIPIELTITDIYGNSETKEVKVVINPNVAPTIHASEMNVYVNDEINLVDGLSAKDDYKQDISINSNMTIDGKDEIVQVNNKYSTPNTYLLTYHVQDVYGNVGTTIRKVKVNGLPYIEVRPQMYDISDQDIKKQVQDAGKAYYEKASDTVKEQPVKTPISMQPIEIDGPSLDFSKVGEYEVTYIAKNIDQKEVRKCVNVVIVDGLQIGGDEKGIELYAQNIVVSQNDLATLTKQEIIEQAKAQGIYYEKDESNTLVKIEDIRDDISVDTSLSEIKNTTKDGGVYELTLTVQHNTLQAEKKIYVFVEGRDVKVDNELVLVASNVNITNIEAKQLTTQTLLTKAHAKVYSIKPDINIQDIEVKQDDLDNIHHVAFSGDTISVTYKATNNLDVVSITKKVVIENSKELPDIVCDVRNHYVGEIFEEVVGVHAHDAGANPIVLTQDNTKVTHAIPLKEHKFISANTYEIAIKVKDMYGNEREVKQLVKVNGLPVIDANPQVYKIGDSTIKDKVKDAAVAYYDKASNIVNEKPTQTQLPQQMYTIVGPTQDFSEVGNYYVTYKVEDRDHHIAIKTVAVIITSDLEIIENQQQGIVLNAYNYALKQEEVDTLDVSGANQKAKAQAFYFEKDNTGTISKLIPLDDKIISNIEVLKPTAMEGKEVNLEYKVTYNGIENTKDVLVVVEGYDYVVSEGVVLYATNLDVANEEAKVLDDTKVIQYAKVNAYVLATKEKIDQIVVHQDDLNKIKANGYDRKTYELKVYVNYDNNKIENEIEVEVHHTLIGPAILIEDETAYVGDVYKKFTGVSAKDASNKKIDIKETTTKETHTIPLTNNKYSKAGTYKVTYDVEDRYGNVTTADKTVRVNGLPEIHANEQKYALDDQELSTKIQTHPNAGYYKATNSVGEAKYQPLKVSWKVIEGPNNDTSLNSVGVYKIEYKVVNEDGKEATKVVPVLLVYQDSLTSNTSDLYISAKGFSLSVMDAKALDEFKVMQKMYADVDAFIVKRDEANNITNSINLKDKVFVDIKDLEKIKAVTSKGGIYQLGFTLEEDKKIVTSKVNVVVIGKNTPPLVETSDGNALAIYANDIHLSNDEAKHLTNTSVIEKADVKAILLHSSLDKKQVRTRLNNELIIRCDDQELEKIQNVGVDGGDYKLTFYVDYVLNDAVVATNMVEINVEIAEKEKMNITNDRNKNEKSPVTNTVSDEVDTSDKSYYWYLIAMLLISLGYASKVFLSRIRKEKD